MSYEYQATTEVDESEAKHVVRELSKQLDAFEIVAENGSTLSAIYPVRPDRLSSWDEDVQFVFQSNSFCVVIHSATRDERQGLIKMVEQAFKVRGIELKLEEE